MERTILGSEFKGGIWHRYFTTPNKKDETLSSILKEKIRFYKLYYPFLEKKQILGKTYEELGIPHVCGDVNKKELYKLFLQQRKKVLPVSKKSKKTEDKSQNYESLLIEKKSRNKSSYKKPTFNDNLIVKQTQVEVNIKLKKNVEKSKNDIAFDKLLFVSTEAKEMSKQPKTVRFNDGIEIHRVSPSQPLYKMKRVGRLFDEPSSVRTEPHYCPQNQEDFFDSDSEFDADTGITSDVEDYDLQDSPPMVEVNQEQEMRANKDIEKSTIYECSEDGFGSTDSDTAKEGDSLILSSKIITVAQGEWVRETERIIVGNSKENEMSQPLSTIYNDKGVNKVRAEIDTEKNVSIDESILERIKCLRISSLTEQEVITNLDMSENGNKQIPTELIKDKLIVKTSSTEHEQEIGNKEVTLNNPSAVCSKIYINNNGKISLENNFNVSINKEELIPADVNTLSYSDMIFNAQSYTEQSLINRIRNKPDILLSENSDFIDDWNSTNNISNENLLDVNANSNASLLESSRDDMRCTDDAIATKGHSNILSVAQKSNAQTIKIRSEETSIVEEEANNVKGKFDEEHFEESDSYVEERDSYQLVVDTDYCEQVSPLADMSDPLQSEEAIEDTKPKIALNNSTHETKMIVGAQCSPSELRDSMTDEETVLSHDSLNLDTSFFIKSDTLGQKELEVNYISPRSFRGVENKQNISGLNELCSSIYSLITKPIMMQSHKLREENNKYDNTDRNISKEAELLKDQVKSKTTNYMFSEFFTNKPTMETVSTTDLINSYEPYLEKDDTASLKIEMRKIIDGETGKNSLTDESQNKANVFQELRKDMQNKSVSATQSLKTAVIEMSQLNCPKPLTAVESQDANEEDTFKAFITSQKLYRDETGNEINELEATDLYQGHIAIKTEPSGMNFLSKVQMWSIYSEDFIGNLTVPSQSTSIIASCNTDLSQREIVARGDQIHNNENSDYENSLELEDSKYSRFDNEENSICESISEKWNSKSNDEKNHETESSFETVTPVKNKQNNDDDEVSTAYETDPETGKLRMNRYLKPISNSTPYEKYKGILNQELESQLDSEELLVHKYFENNTRNIDSYSVLQNEVLSTEVKRENEGHYDNSASEYLPTNISPNTISESKDTKNTEISFTLMQNDNQDEFNKTETKSVINCRDLNTFSECESLQHPKNIVTSKSSVHSDGQPSVNQENSSESIIENSDPNSIGKFKKILRNEKPTLNIELSTIGTNKKDDLFNKTDARSSCKATDNTTIISETNTSNTYVECYSNKASFASIIESRDLSEVNKLKSVNKNLTLERTSTAAPAYNYSYQLHSDKTSIESIIPDTDLTNTCKFTNVKHAKAVSADTEYSINNKHEECNKSSSKSIIENSNPSTSDELTSGKYGKNLVAITEQVINSRQDAFPEISSEDEFQKIVHSDKVTIKQEEYVPAELPLSNNFPISLDCSHISNMENSELISHSVEPNIDRVESNSRSSFRKSHVTFLIRNETLKESHDCNNQEIKSERAMKLSFDGNTSLHIKSQNVQDNITKDNITSCISENDKTDNHESDIVNNNYSVNLKEFENLTISDHNAAMHNGGLVQESQVISSVSSKISLPNYFTRSNHKSGLKRKLKTIYEIGNRSDNSPLSEEEDSEMMHYVSSVSNTTIQSTADRDSGSSVETDTSSMKMTWKRLNTDIRKKRAKLIKENPAKKGSTSSSEDDVKIPLPMKRKILELKTLSVDSSSEPQIIKQSKVFVDESCGKPVSGRGKQQKKREKHSIQNEEMEKKFLSLTLSSENKSNCGTSDFKASDKSNIFKKQKETERYKSSEILKHPNVHQERNAGEITESYLSFKAVILSDDDLESGNRPIVHRTYSVNWSDTNAKKTNNFQEKQAITKLINKGNIKKSHLSNKLQMQLPTSMDPLFSGTSNKPPTSAAFTPNLCDDSLKKYLFNNSKSISEPNPNAETGLHNKISTIDVTLPSILEKSESHKTSSATNADNSSTHSEPQEGNTKNAIYSEPEQSRTDTWANKIKHLKEKTQTISRKFTSSSKIGKKSHKSYPLYKGHGGDKCKENIRLSLRNLKSSNPHIKGSENKNPRPPLRTLNAGPSNIELDRDRKHKFQSGNTKKKNLPNQNKNVKSSVVCWVGTNETSQIGNSPEVNTLLRRTYFMGNN